MRLQIASRIRILLALAQNGSGASSTLQRQVASRIRILLALLPCLTSRASAQAGGLLPQPDAVLKPAQAAAVRITLPCGARVLFRQDTNSETVAICVVVRAGVGDEDIPGVGNIAARALFGSNRNQSTDAVSRSVFEVGGSLETLWTPDYTSITCVTNRDRFEDALWQVCQALKNADFAPDTVERARAAALADLAKEESDPFRAAYAALRSRMYHESPYRLPFAGTESGLRRVRPEQVRRFYERNYTPARTVIAVVGNLPQERVERAAGNYLIDFDRPEPRRSRPALPEPLRESTRVTREVPSQTTLVVAGFPGPGVSDSDYPAFQALWALAGGGKSSRLFRALRENAGVGYVVGANAPLLAREAHLLAYVEYDPARVSQEGSHVNPAGIEQLLKETVQGIVRNPPDAAELERARRYAIGTHALARQRARDRAFFLAWFEALGPGCEMDAELPRRIAAVTPQDLARVARRYLANCVVAVAQPVGREPTSPTPH